MQFSETWLRQLVNPNINTQTLVNQLNMAGIEVGEVTPVAGPFSGVVIGRVLSIAAHPNASKLRICQVAITPNAAVPLNIVCGASNVDAELLVPVATIGAVLPGGMRIGPATLRGVESSGMICSAAELGLEEKSTGIMILPPDAPVGQDIRVYLDLDDQMLTVEPTPDRADCLSVSGIAKEVGVLNRIAVNAVATHPIAAQISDYYTVHVLAPQACPRYTCRIIRDLNPNAKTPPWLQERLRRSGIRTINPVVDVTNYILLELGQPMHAFDLARIEQHIEVRMAKSGEQLLLLDGRAINLQENTLVIADAVKPIAMAGIMGGELSGVISNTSDILLESAFFSPTIISGHARTYGLATDSSHRFERGVDPGLQSRAIERATQLLLAIMGGKPGPIVDITAPEHLPQPQAILLRRERIQKVLGMSIADGEITDILYRLGMVMVPVAEGWQVTAPAARFDVRIEVDLIAELGRIYGYNQIPATQAQIATSIKPIAETSFALNRAKDVLVDLGYQEVITYSFVSPEIQTLLEPNAATVRVANPLSQDQSVMRTSLWPGLLLAANYNQSHQTTRVRIFESGLGFRPDVNGLVQLPLLAGLATGSRLPEQWGTTTQMVDFFDVKQDLESILGITQLKNVRFVAAANPALHSGRSAKILCNNAFAGWIGALHPRIQRHLDFAADVIMFELHLPALATGLLPAFRLLSKYPSTRRDIAIVVKQDIDYARILECISAGRQKILQDIFLFDVYTASLESGQRSLGIGLILQDSSHTLGDAEVNAVIADILQDLEQDFGATLRAA